MGTCGMVVRGIPMRLATMFRESRPIYPRDTVEYQRSFQEAEVLYKEWLESRKDHVGLQLLAIRKSKKETAYDVRSEGDEG
jgi:hypothetical protein